MQRQEGFTLVEVIASLMIISIILLSFFPLLITAKKTSVMNVDKLVMIQLAQASLDRLKLDPYGYIEIPSSNPPYLFKNNRAGTFTYTYSQCKTNDCRDAYRIALNERIYYIEVTATQNRAESDSKLINIITTIKDEAQKKNYSVEGYVIVYD
ncbi:type IV pilus modification PilV family protein [Sporosarcina ureae]|uniref:type IV pilus modification PilV family protein n=1 Tax=Sporosarcina ureae TaxID=1571 RepID=UPI000A17F190|nr:type II secretion system protein [Sporosarcina ureae]ARK20455.1 hypothetical protein SporoP32a_02160 [Sporosarcina ureae]